MYTLFYSINFSLDISTDREASGRDRGGAGKPPAWRAHCVGLDSCARLPVRLRARSGGRKVSHAVPLAHATREVSNMWTP